MKLLTESVIISSGGFAGLELAKKLSGNNPFEVIVADRNNYHFFPPLQYQVPTAFIKPSNISDPYRRMFQGKENIRFHRGKLVSVVPETNTIETDKGCLSYD